MKLSNEVKDEIEDLFKDNLDYTIRLLSGDVEAIQELSFDSSISPAEVIYAYEKNKIDELYQEAKFKLRKRKLYFQIVDGTSSPKKETSQVKVKK